MRICQHFLGRDVIVEDPRKFGYGRFYYFKDENMSDLLCDIINDDSDESKNNSDSRSCDKKIIGMIMEGIWLNGKLNSYGRTIDFKGNMYLGEYVDG